MHKHLQLWQKSNLILLFVTKLIKLFDKEKPRLAKVWALFYVFQQVITRGCALFNTAPAILEIIQLKWYYWIIIFLPPMMYMPLARPSRDSPALRTLTPLIV